MRMKIPKKAEAEICRKLAENLQISSDEISDILEKYGVREDDRALQRSYRKRLGQQLMASFRDEAGKREILAAPNGKGGMVYIIIDCCNDGYAAIKTAHCSFPTGLVPYAHEPYSSDHVLEYPNLLDCRSKEIRSVQKQCFEKLSFERNRSLN